MADDLPAQQAVFLPGAAGVVDDQGNAAGVGAVGDNPGMLLAVGVTPVDQVAVLPQGECFIVHCNGQRPAEAFQELHLVLGAAVVDVGVGAGEPPQPGVQAKVIPHVLVDQLLQVVTGRPQGPDDHVGAHAPVRVHVPPGVTHGLVRGVITDSPFNLGAGTQQDQVVGRALLHRDLLHRGEVIPGRKGKREGKSGQAGQLRMPAPVR